MITLCFGFTETEFRRSAFPLADDQIGIVFNHDRSIPIESIQINSVPRVNTQLSS
jgi:hypothetical protein